MLPDDDLYVAGDLGAVTWFAALAPLAGTDVALPAIIGYDDDAFATYVGPEGETCGYFSIFFDDASEAEEFESVLVGLLDFPNVVIDGEQVALTICEPIGDPYDQRFGTMFPLLVANGMTLYHLRSGESEETARCAAIAHASTFNPYRDGFEFTLYEDLVAEADQFVGSCTSG